MGVKFTGIAVILTLWNVHLAEASSRILRALACEYPRCAPPPRNCRPEFVIDQYGCHIKCVYACGGTPCPLLHCSPACATGYLRDKNGCDTCNCRCPEETCRDTCPAGYVIDEYGCQTCTCKTGAVEEVTSSITNQWQDVVTSSTPSQTQKVVTEETPTTAQPSLAHCPGYNIQQ